jgi:hypothetical protein
MTRATDATGPGPIALMAGDLSVALSFVARILRSLPRIVVLEAGDG